MTSWIIAVALAGQSAQPNGFDDYLRAIRVLEQRGVRDYLSSRFGTGDGKPANLPGLSAGADRLSHARWAADRFRPAIELLREGNSKAWSDPRSAETLGDPAPEFNGYKQLAKVITDVAYAAYSRGDSARGTHTLLDGLVFSERIGGSSVLGQLVGHACFLIVLNGFDRELSRLSQRDALQVIEVTTELLRDTSALPSAYAREEAFASRAALSSIDRPGYQEPQDFLDASTHSYYRAVDQHLSALTPAAKQTLRVNVRLRLRQLMHLLQEAFRKDEAKWSDGFAELDAFFPREPNITTPSGLADRIALDHLPITAPVVNAALIRRAKVRLLRLHARLRIYRWNHGRMPKDLSEVAAADEINDPLSGTRFLFEPRTEGYRLNSLGSKKTGEIDMEFGAAKPVKNEEVTPP